MDELHGTGERVRQETLTLVAAVRDPMRAKFVLRALAQACDAQKQPSLFAGLGIHFARIVLIDEPASGPYQASLVLESNFDTELPEDRGADARHGHLSALARARTSELSSLFEHAHGFAPNMDSGRLAEALVGCLVRETATYQGHRQRDLARIALEAEVRREALLCVSKLPANTPPSELHRKLREHLTTAAARDGRRFSGLDLTKPAPDEPDPVVRKKKLAQKKRPWIVNGWAALPLVPALPLVAYHQDRELCFDLQREAESLGPSDLRRLAENAESEDHAVQNALTHLVPVRTGLARKYILRNAHFYIDRLAKTHFNYVEQLGGIPSIHFAKWLLIDGGKRLLFFSNFDGSWESYLGDFVDRAAIGLNLAWSATENYPRTRWLFHGGANDEECFKAWARAYQRPTQLFYRAYPDLSVLDINHNSLLRWELHRESPLDLDAFVRRLT